MQPRCSLPEARRQTTGGTPEHFSQIVADMIGLAVIMKESLQAVAEPFEAPHLQDRHTMTQRDGELA